MQNLYFNQVYNYNTYQIAYPNVTAIFNPMAPTALANAFADVLFLPRSAISINSFAPLSYSGCGIGGFCNPSATATLTVLYQGTGLIPSVSAVTYAFYEAIYAVTSQEQSPLGNALIKYGFPNVYTLYQVNGNTITSKSYIAGQPTPAPTSTPAPSSTPAPTTFGATTVNATSVGDNVTTISHLNYPTNENLYWYLKAPRKVANGAKLVYTIYFPFFYLDSGYDYLYVSSSGGGYGCTGSSCGTIRITSTTGITLQIISSSKNWNIGGGATTGFTAQLTWQIYKPRKLLSPFQSSRAREADLIYLLFLTHLITR